MLKEEHMLVSPLSKERWERNEQGDNIGKRKKKSLKVEIKSTV